MCVCVCVCVCDFGLRVTCPLMFPFCMCGILNGAIICVEPTIQCRVAEYYWIVNWKGYGRKRSQPDLILCQMLFEGLGEIAGKACHCQGSRTPGLNQKLPETKHCLLLKLGASFMIERWCVVLVARNWRYETVSVSEDILLRGLCSGILLQPVPSWWNCVRCWNCSILLD